MELDPRTHIYLESVSPGECYKHIYMTTPFCIKKEPKMVLLHKKGEGITGLKLWHTDTT